MRLLKVSLALIIHVFKQRYFLRETKTFFYIICPLNIYPKTDLHKKIHDLHLLINTFPDVVVHSIYVCYII